MKRKLNIELLEENGTISLYSPKFKGQTQTEFEIFLSTYKETHPHDVGEIMKRLSIIQREGINDRYFRFEGTPRDRVGGLPSHLDTSKLRLYCIFITPSVVIAGSGGIKNSDTYNVDPLLNSCVETLQKIDFEIKCRQWRKSILMDGCQLVGELSFFIQD